MSTPSAPGFEPQPLAGTAWRAVDAPATAALLSLVDDWDELAELEAALDGPGAAGRTDRGLAGVRPEALVTEPFRARPACPVGSPFRGAHGGGGVFYGAASAAGAIADLVALRRRFFRHTDPTRLPDRPAAVVVFAAPLNARSAVDLTAPPIDASARTIARTGPVLARTLRAAGIQTAVFRGGGEEAPMACLAEGSRMTAAVNGNRRQAAAEAAPPPAHRAGPPRVSAETAAEDLPPPGDLPPGGLPPGGLPPGGLGRGPAPPDRAVAVFVPTAVSPPASDRIERWSLLLRADGALAWREGASGERLAFFWDP